MTSRVVILGGEGSGLIVADAVAALQACGEDVSALGFLNDSHEPGSIIGGLTVLGRFDDWRSVAGDVCFIAAFPRAKDGRTRLRRLRALGIPLERFATIRHPRAVVSAAARVGHGCFIAANAVIETGADIGAHAIVRAGAYVSHDVRLGEFGFVGPNATLLGRCRAGEGVHIGANAVCREGIEIGEYAVVGIGAVVVRNIEPFTVVAGNPAQPLRTVVAAR